MFIQNRYIYFIKVRKNNQNVLFLLFLAASGDSGCTYKGTKYQFGSEFHDGCEAYCVCLNVGVQCANIECPTQLGLEVIDPHCTEWVVEPADFVANPPECCPKNVTCRSNGSCIHEGKRYDNWQEVRILF